MISGVKRQHRLNRNSPLTLLHGHYYLVSFIGVFCQVERAEAKLKRRERVGGKRKSKQVWESLQSATQQG